MVTTQDMSLIVEGKYRLVHKIGEGSFGKIFSGINKNTHEEVAVKIERSEGGSVLRNEARIYTALRGEAGIPCMRACGKEGKFNYLVIDLLDVSLEDQRIRCGGRLGLKTVLAMGVQMIRRIEQVHNFGIVHRDVKPDNFLLGRGDEAHVLHLIDFGLAKRYINKSQHVDGQTGRKLCGTARYVSLNVHDGVTPSRRDDLESIAYVLIYLFCGRLPWQGVQCEEREEKHRAIGRIKKETNMWDACKDYALPGEILVFMEYCRRLGYDDTPDYGYLRGLLMNLYKHHGFLADNLYDWSSV
jgi:casein kinase I family protein HRR25